jgi:hypothetical protein
MKAMIVLASACCCALVLACSSNGIVEAPVTFCAEDPVALRVYVRDSVSGIFAGSSTTVTASTDQSALTFRSAVGTDSAPFMIPGTPGTYTLLIRKDGYRDWTKTGITVLGVASGACKGIPTTTEITAQLIRAS